MTDASALFTRRSRHLRMCSRPVEYIFISCILRWIIQERKSIKRHEILLPVRVGVVKNSCTFAPASKTRNKNHLIFHDSQLDFDAEEKWRSESLREKRHRLRWAIKVRQPRMYRCANAHVSRQCCWLTKYNYPELWVHTTPVTQTCQFFLFLSICVWQLNWTASAKDRMSLAE